MKICLFVVQKNIFFRIGNAKIKSPLRIFYYSKWTWVRKNLI